ncbi:hypothetical protein [uncultured Aliiroseovarius sp.]|uniref:hypothetical protein n=1 Tax=uncultured Aliiroseovarius sp. TaxID=1658783 RepID=UPI0026323142|nr:hypothetical protein [uncultured Aliiroseovarius sp.]
MKFSLKLVLPIGVLFIGLAFVGYRSTFPNGPTSVETFFATVLLTAASWFISAAMSEQSAMEAAESSANEKIDDIAWLSSKKLADQSTNFFELERYIEQTLVEKNEIEKLSETDLTAIIRDLRQLRRANTGLMQDWNRVASQHVTDEVTHWIEEQLTLFGELDFSYRPTDNQETADEMHAPTLPLSARPTRTVPVVGDVSQEIEGASSNHNLGEITVEIQRPIYSFTATGKIEPNFSSPPHNVDVKLIGYPSGTPNDIKVHGGAGTPFDFSVHLKSRIFGVMLPAGTYIFAYELSGKDDEIPAS